jgi:hypothetical protein
VLASASLVLTCVSAVSAQELRDTYKLSDREKTFLRIVMSGDEAKAAEFAELSNINPNSIAGFPLSAWFYGTGIGFQPTNTNAYTNLNVHRIIFERFRQNPNPKVTDISRLDGFCGYAVYPRNIPLENSPDSPARRAFLAEQETAKHTAVETMATGFVSLVRYGLLDKRLVQAIFQGCFFRNAGGLTDRNSLSLYAYDHLITKLLKAGADLNVQGRGDPYPIEKAVSALDIPLVERLIRDGANVKVHVRPQCPGRNVQSNLYGHLFGYVNTPRAGEAIEMVKVLSHAGLSPFAKTVGAGCTERSIYDYAIDRGKLDVAKAIKEAAAAGPAMPSMPQVPSPVSAASHANLAPIGDWHLGSTPDGRPFASSTTAEGSGRALKELRLECVPGGRLEYVPVTSTGAPVQALWFEGSNTAIVVSNGRVVGPAAVQLSKEFLAEGAGRAPDDEWFVALVVDEPSLGSKVRGRGFAETRKYLLANCKQ